MATVSGFTAGQPKHTGGNLQLHRKRSSLSDLSPNRKSLGSAQNVVVFREKNLAQRNQGDAELVVADEEDFEDEEDEDEDDGVLEDDIAEKTAAAAVGDAPRQTNLTKSKF